MNIHRKLALLCAIFAAVSVFAAAQSNEMVDLLLSQASARLDTAAYMVLAASSADKESLSAEDAFKELKKAGWFSPAAKPEDPLAADLLAFITMKALGLPGGIFYTVFPSPRYAFREFVFRDVMSASPSPGRLVGGDEVLRVLRLAIELKGGAK